MHSDLRQTDRPVPSANSTEYCKKTIQPTQMDELWMCSDTSAPKQWEKQMKCMKKLVLNITRPGIMAKAQSGEKLQEPDVEDDIHLFGEYGILGYTVK